MFFKNKTGKPDILEALIPIIFLVGALSYNVFVFKDDALLGSNQLILLVSAAVAVILGFRRRIGWSVMQKGIVRSISTALPAMLILLMIGALAGTWLISGIVPFMIYYGLQILNPVIFLFAACIVCSLVSILTGSSWSTAATVGIALVGIGQALGIHEGLVVGAIISGAYFGDKMSPLSDTTNLAAAMAETELFTHIKYMALTTVPSIIITLIAYLFIGFSFTETDSQVNVNNVLLSLENVFNLHWSLLIVPFMVILLIIKKVPALPVLFIGTILGAVFAVWQQPEVVTKIGGEGTLSFKAMYKGTMKAMYTDISITTDNAIVNRLLSTGGMFGMLNTVWLIICAMVFGGAMEATGFLKKISESILKLVRSRGSLIASTSGTCMFFNVTASDQYLAIVVPGRMFKNIYKKQNLKPQNLSRTIEDSGTVTSVLVPWNTCGATQASVLGVSTFIYAPYCFFNILSPLMTLFYGYFGIKIAKIK